VPTKIANDRGKTVSLFVVELWLASLERGRADGGTPLEKALTNPARTELIKQDLQRGIKPKGSLHHNKTIERTTRWGTPKKSNRKGGEILKKRRISTWENPENVSQITRRRGIFP